MRKQVLKDEKLINLDKLQWNLWFYYFKCLNFLEFSKLKQYFYIYIYINLYEILFYLLHYTVLIYLLRFYLYL